MKKINMVDLHGQYQRIKTEVDSAIQRVIDSAAYVKGPEVKTFESELANYLGVNHAIACANGTDALQISLMALGLKPGDEVITPNFTFISTVEVAVLLGLKPVIADVEPGTFNIDIASVEKALSPRSRAIIPVHLFGQCANMDEIMRIAKANNLIVIEDVAQALSADYTGKSGETVKAGTMGQIGCTSFFPSKNLGCFGDGGAMFTNDKALADELAAITHHGMRKRYYYDTTGLNSRLDTLQAAILSVKLKYLDEYSRARSRAAGWYDKALGGTRGISIPVRSPFSTHVFHQYTIRLEGINREALQKHLELKGIPAMIYYPFPVHLQKAFQYLGYREGDFPVSEMLCKSVLSLPMHTELDEEQVNYIAGSIVEFVNF
ncbi:MAG TPA: DegT/DnrJ/EryC1/StrS family aminotransferase [Bacteroidales bacterium]|nr:DegT/DnrJ/EryC1/StrS family aminotransferase [Bacteroidales bacterium]